MKRTLVSTAVACLFLSSCATPDASDPAAQAEHTALTASAGAADGRLADMATAALERDLREREAAYQAERSGLMQKLQAMNAELAELKSRMQTPSVAPAAAGSAASAASAISTTPATMAAEPDPIAALVTASGNRIHVTREPVRAHGKTVAPVPNSAVQQAVIAARGGQAEQAAAAPLTSRETIVIQDKGMIFRVMHGFAHTEFRPSRSLQQQLLQAARAGKHIEIRGRTDAGTANDIDRNIAMRRALNARVFLANNGIHPRKMHIDYLAAGDNVADNRTAEGRARNRRVEIETVGMSRDVLEDLAAVIRQDLQ